MAQRSTVRDVAEAAGVSLATVSLVLNGRAGVGEETRRRVLATIDQLGYQRRGLRSVIGLLIERLPVPAYNDPIVGLIIHGIELEASRRGYHVLLSSVEPSASQLPALITEQQVSGLVVLGGGDIADAYIHLLADTGLPLVLADNFVDGLAVPCVLADNESGAYQAVRHLLDLGHERVAVLQGPRKYKTLTERLSGYVRAHEQAQRAPDRDLMIAPLHHSPRKGYHETLALLQLPRHRWPTAIFAISDKTALGALEALRDAGLVVPDQMALVGFDDIVESAHMVPNLTTVRLPAQTLGEVAVQRLIESIEGAGSLPMKTVLYTELVVRESSGSHQHVAAT